MPKVILKFKENTIAEFALNKGGTISIGRLNDNQVVVENLAVSGHHAKIDSVGEGFLLTDLQSKNGTFVNMQRVNSHWLKDGDQVTVGKHTLLFVNEEQSAAAAPGKAGGDLEKTMVMDTAAYREMMAKSAPPAGAQAGETVAGQGPEEPPAVLTFLSGGEGEIKLSKKIVKIGKAANNDIVVGGMFVGATAANISKRPAGYFLGYVAGFSKPKVNGQAIKETVQLNDFDTIEVGNTKLQFNVGKK
ncbi:MAG: FHA domain-containing protein [Thermodesulfobacteriota bacterium]